MGMNLRRLSSIEAQRNIQFVLESAIVVLVIRVVIVNIDAGDHINLIRL